MKPLLLVSFLALAACASTAPPAPAADITGAWRLVSVDGAATATERQPSLRLEGGRASGNGGCNAFGGDYTLQGDTLIADRVISTRMACISPDGAPDRMAQEQAFLATLSRAQVARSGDQLTLRGAHTLAFTRDQEQGS